MGPTVILIIVLTAVITAGLGAAWQQFLEQRRRAAVLDVIKAAIVAGREPPPEILAELAQAGRRKPPWSEVVLFSALAFGFWLAFSRVPAASDAANAFLVVASTMSLTAVGCLVLALTGQGAPAKPKDGQ